MSVNIRLDATSTEFTPGRPISGFVDVKLKEPTKIKQVVLKFKGIQKCSWSRRLPLQKNGRKEENVVDFEGRRRLLDMGFLLVPGEVEMPVGTHTYPFQFLLPPKLAGTMEGIYGSNSYYIMATVEASKGKDYFWKTSFKVTPTLDLNSLEALHIPFFIEKRKTIGLLLWAGDLHVTVSAPKCTYTSQEIIPFQVQIDNNTYSFISSLQIEIKKSIKYLATTSTALPISSHDTQIESSCLVKKVFETNIRPYGGLHSFECSVSLGCTELSTIDDNQVIKVGYDVEVTCKSGLSSDVVCCGPIVIGSDPISLGRQVEDTYAPSAPVMLMDIGWKVLEVPSGESGKDCL